MNKIKIVLLLLIATLSFSSCSEKANQETEARLEEKVKENFDWLLGSWKRNNEEEGKETFEIWEKRNSSEYSGIGFTMQNNDTLKQEKI